MKIETKPLLVALSDPVKVSTRRTTLPILNCLLIGGAHGQLSIAATDLDVWVERHIDHKKADLPTLCINAKRFSQCIANAGEYVTLDYDEKRKRLVVASGGWRQEIGVMDAAEFPKRPVSDGKPVAINYGDLAACIEVVAWAASDDPNEGPDRQFTKTVRIVAGPTKLETFAFAGTVLARNTRALISGDTEFHIPAAQSMLLVDAMRSDESKVLLSEKRITVEHAGGMVSATMLVAQWPDTTKVTERESKPLGKVPRNELMDACRRIAGLYAIDKFGSMNGAVEGKALKLSSETSTDSATESVPLVGAKDGRFVIDVFKLRDALINLEEGDVALRVNDRQLFLEQGERTIIISLLGAMKPK